MENVRKDIRQEVTNSIIEMIEAGGLTPWQRPWGRTGERMIPHNFGTKLSYSGVNVCLLWMHSMKRGYASQSWLTFKQANMLGGRIKKGAVSTRCCFFKKQVIKDDKAPDGEKTIPVINTFNLFNLEEISGLNLDSYSVLPDAGYSYIMQSYLDREGIQFVMGGDDARYNSRTDVIAMPPIDSFDSDEAFAAVLSHEMIHSTGHKDRLDRDMSKMPSRNSPEYYTEELVAELGRAMFCAEYGIDSCMKQSATYIAGFLEGLKNDKRFIFDASTAASRASRFIIGDNTDMSGVTGIPADVK